MIPLSFEHNRHEFYKDYYVNELISDYLDDINQEMDIDQDDSLIGLAGLAGHI